MIRKCSDCGGFTMQEKHCGQDSETTRPPKFSFPDNYGEYRRKAKKGGD